MTDFQTDPLSEIVKAILEDGIIDDTEVTQLRTRLFADGIIDKEEAEALFEINDAIKGRANSPAWVKLFVNGIGDFLLKDEHSLGVVDDEEALWLIGKLEGDGEIDANERALLATLKAKATSLPANLQAKLKTWGM